MNDLSSASSRVARRGAALVLAVVAVAGSGVRVQAWGFGAHRKIAELTIDTLPEPLRQFYAHDRVFLIEHSVDPDLWRLAGFETEPPRHFVDLDAYGAYPFASLPHEYAAAVARFGEATVIKNGTLPWRVEEMSGRLQRAFEERDPPQLASALRDARFFAAVLAHYLGDAHVPFHAVVNYDGQSTGQLGIHSRFEAELYDRFGARMHFSPAPAEDVGSSRELVFRTLMEGFKLVDPILRADREAIDKGTVYDDAYFERFFEKTGSIVEARMTQAAHAVGSVIYTAWLRAGKPDLPLEPRRVVRPVRSR